MCIRDSCTPLQAFFKVTLHEIAPGIVSGAIMAFTMSLDDFVISYFVSGLDGYETVLTVDSLTYLKRGGRLSPTSAFFGTMLDLKPIIVMGKSGKMDAADKVQGRKKAIRALVERTADLIEDPAGQTLIIMHADAPEDAQRLAEMLRARIPELKNIRIVMVGPVIGAHCGPGTLASAFMGKPRQV